MATEVELAWAAGILDGEGCISIILTPPGKYSVTPRHVLHVKVTMGHLPTVERFAVILGNGTVQKHAARSTRTNASYSYIVQARKADAVLQLLRPYLVTKAEEADVAFEFAALPLGPRGGKKGGKAVPQEILELRNHCYWKLRRLKPRWRFYSEGMEGCSD